MATKKRGVFIANSFSRLLIVRSILQDFIELGKRAIGKVRGCRVGLFCALFYLDAADLFYVCVKKVRFK